MGTATTYRHFPRALRTRLLQTFGVLVALPFLAAAIGFAAKLTHLYSRAGCLVISQYLGACLLAFGLALGIVGSTFALTCCSTHARTLWAAATLFGCSHVVLGFIARWAVENVLTGRGPSVLPFLLPVGMWACSVWIALKAHGADARESCPADMQPATTEEQPQPLSRP